LEYREFFRKVGVPIYLVEQFGDARVNELWWFGLGRLEDDWKMYLEKHVELKAKSDGQIIIVPDDNDIDFSLYDVVVRNNGFECGLILSGEGRRWKKIAGDEPSVAYLGDLRSFFTKHKIRRKQLLDWNGDLGFMRVHGIIRNKKNVQKKLRSSSRLGKLMREVNGIYDERIRYRFEEDL